MPYIENKAADGSAIKINYEDFGTGKPVVLIHGWPVSHEMWEYQVAEIVNNGFRCIAYDRRGFGQSDRPWSGYDYDHLASDLDALINELDLTDVTLVGFSMGGGEVIRYISTYGTAKVSKTVLISSIVPLVLKTSDHEEGVPREMFDEIIANIFADRPAFLTTFGKQFFNEGLLNKPVSSEIQDWMHHMAMISSPKATRDCVRSFSETDFRAELAKVNVPTLIIHGDADQTVPIEATSDLSSKGIPNAEYVIFENAPHGLFITHKDELNEHLIAFLKK
ncbi:MAG: alpha/beta hydrolase [Flavobacteriales bacterium]|nr:MAG: alpha/beta hydrolase [Flavobacteriales bacterium]